MRELTQSSEGLVGNCWQTCVACILDVDPETLPSQKVLDACTQQADSTVKRVGPGYNNALQSYLQHHHGLAYVELHLPREAYASLSIRGYHMMTGTTVRSAAMDGLRHVVVGLDGQQHWDPHPSRAGLLDDIHWAMLVPYPAQWRKWGWDDMPCVCPEHAGKPDPRSRQAGKL
jgi:hypothetical protein